MTQSRILDLQGQQFGRLTVIAFAGVRNCGMASQHTSWTCRCECGSVYDYAMGNLRSGATTQCRECGLRTAQKGATKHGKARTPIYTAWDRWKRLLWLCPEWQTFEVFYAAVGNPPDGKWLCRPDPSKPLGPSNAVWLTAKERKRMHLDLKIDEYVTLTGEPKQKVAERFGRITRERQRQLLQKAKGLCQSCGSHLIWLGEGKACLCHRFRAQRRRHWVARLMARLQNGEGMSLEEARVIMGRALLKNLRAKRVVPADFRERCLTAGGTGALAAHYDVCLSLVYSWIKSLGLKRKSIYVDDGEATKTTDGEHGGDGD